ncbi:dentin sialophosphoprotein isoform X2 [Apis mellifera]|uniref:Dentin sialophosphoprotein isoform X2 n=1 Tax=Apis mellifera TaxID=7460 RepID=A0A7M7RBD3_APIME|nr:dentin sialophosphoprotein isoform X2 [Apis mellifera]|eukprot:XP_625160.3 dentin sialophosphoprotein isoform X2 [Apis mellifera]
MSESDGEQVARSVALEQAYVHEVYEQCAEKTVQSRHWPRIYQFLEELEPGALVCDIGCGNGKYLSVNHSIFKVGVDRCKRFTDIAREKENEVLICDNLALPFRDESFDAVLSIAVVHHFATIERRVHALKELARVLRIGGRLVISVWAMEQKHRKFESQDVLIPWPKAYCMNSNRSKRSSAPYASNLHSNQNAQKFLSSSKRNSQRKCKSKSYWIDPIFSPSPSTSSLSSPNETCYSFFRRALQKLAGGRRGSGSRPWFLDSWQSGSGKNQKDYEQEEPPDVDELPIELRRVEDVNMTLNKQSSIPGLCSMLTSELNLDGESRTSSSMSGSKPRLVKQKSHFVDDIGLEHPDNTAIHQLSKDIPDFQITSNYYSKRGSILKQSSMNEELMSTDRLAEKERVRRNIMKQASLNEDIICKGKTFESLKDSLYSVNATKRFQLLKSGLTNKIKQSTTNIEVSGISIKNGFVKILQGWKSSENEATTTSNVLNDEASKAKNNDSKVQPVSVPKKETEGIERRLSREDGSDSSKDSSLQSDTSVDSEDSFASVIFVPKQDAQPATEVIIPASNGHQLGSISAPPSPRVKQPPDTPNSRLKVISISPLLKQFPATSKSLPSSSPPGLSPCTLNSALTRSFFNSPTISNQQQVSSGDNSINAKKTEISNNDYHQPTNGDLQSNKKNIESEVCRRNSFFEDKKPSLQAIRAYKSLTENVEVEETKTVKDTTPLLRNVDDSPDTSLQEKNNFEINKEEENRKARLNQIKELLKQKPGFATRTKPSFPLVRRASTTASGRLEAVTKVLPRLLSLELFNPETDDLDSDSSGVSSPDSVGSVISVISDERYMAKKDNNNKSECTESEVLDSSAENMSEPSDVTVDSSGYVADFKEDETKTIGDNSLSQSSRLLEAAANVASSLEDAVETAITKTHSKPFSTQTAQQSDLENSISDENKIRKSNIQLPEVEDTWNEECRKHLIDFTEKLSEKNLLHERDENKNNQQILNEALPLRKDLDKRNLESSTSYDISSSLSNKSKYNDLSNTIAWLSNTNNGFHEDSLMHRSTSDDIMDFVMVSNTGEFMNEKETSMNKQSSEKSYLRSANSMESSDIGESIDNTISFSDGSRAESTGRLCSSMMSLLSNVDYPKSYAEKRRLQLQRRSASEETPPRYPDNNKRSTDCLVTTTGSNDSLSGSSSQESLPSDRGGGAITYHQYYHVFREGELDQLINKYVENLHIISSYYDHASWCIVAEKVQVWTI